MNQNKNNNSPSKKKPGLNITLDRSQPVPDERPIARLHKLFQGFKQTYGPKGDVKK